MTEAGILTAVGLILSTAMAFLGGAWAYVNSQHERERRQRELLEQRQWERIEALEKRDEDLRKWLRKQGIQTALNEEPTPPAETRLKRGPA